jgi:hypothetical protein
MQTRMGSRYLQRHITKTANVNISGITTVNEIVRMVSQCLRSVAKMAFKVGDKAKVVDKESLLYNKTVELIEVSDEAYIFNSETPKLKLVVHESAMQRTIEWESSPDRAETNFDKLIGQNGELVEERKKQVLAGALGIVQRYCEEKSNKMEVVAALFGKKLGEEFDIKWGVCEYTIRFTNDGMEVTDDYGKWYEAQLYRALLTGEAMIVNE